MLRNGKTVEGYRGVLEKGSRIKILKILLKNHPEIGGSIHPIGIVLDGDWSGTKVDLHRVSKTVKVVVLGNDMYSILTNDPLYLVRIDISKNGTNK